MRARFRGLLAQEVVGPGAVALGLVLLWLSWTIEAGHGLSLPLVTLAVGLTVGLVFSYEFPIHLRPHTKVYMGSVPLYLMAALLPPPLAVTASGLGIVAGNLVVRSRHALPVSAIATDAGRWMIVACLGSSVAHSDALTGPLQPLLLIATCAVLWSGDIMTAALLFSPLRSSGRLSRVLVNMVRDAGATEAAQYLVALLGALAARQGFWALLLLLLPIVLVYMTTKHTRELRDTTRQMLEVMADSVDMRDPYTGGHSRRVAELSAGILRALPMRGPEADLIISAARVHDIGKIGIPDSVLRKDGRLSHDEWEIMKTHPVRGAELLVRYPDFSRGVEIVRHHHEQWDGQGYPDGLAGTDIPLGARVIAVADSFDAMTSNRPYRAGMPIQRAVTILREGSGTQWEPAIVEAFLRSVADQLEESSSQGRPAMSLAVGH